MHVSRLIDLFTVSDAILVGGGGGGVYGILAEFKLL